MENSNWFEKKSHDSWSVFKVMGEIVEGYERLSKVGPCISIFGSARTPESDFFYKETVKLSELISKKGLGIITGGGPGIMEAANKGAKNVGGISSTNPPPTTSSTSAPLWIRWLTNREPQQQSQPVC